MKELGLQMRKAIRNSRRTNGGRWLITFLLMFCILLTASPAAQCAANPSSPPLPTQYTKPNAVDWAIASAVVLLLPGFSGFAAAWIEAHYPDSL